MSPGLLALGLLLSQAHPGDVAPGDLAAAKALYASASYEEALVQLSTVRTEQDEDQVDEYRALCLLALGRTPEAERTLERVVTRKPLFVPNEADVSPRLLTLLHDVRKRMLPATVRVLYARARSEYDGQEYGLAVSDFTDLLKILADPDLAGSAAVTDLKSLAEGFVKLASADLTSSQAALTPSPAAPRGTTTNLSAPRRAVIYSAADTDVTPPGDLDRAMPTWAPVDRAQARLDFRGTLEVVIDEHGNVESAVIRKSIVPQYDTILLEAAKHWRFTPATRNGQAVKYRKFIDVVLRPSTVG